MASAISIINCFHTKQAGAKKRMALISCRESAAVMMAPPKGGVSLSAARWLCRSSIRRLSQGPMIDQGEACIATETVMNSQQ